MCELFGRSGKTREDITRLLKEFYSHAKEHPDGWGLYLNSDDETFFDLEERRADVSEKLSRILSGKIEAKDVIAHIRLATIGYDTRQNPHPFRGFDISGREWVLAHNGTLFHGDVVSKYFYVQEGDTDSERLFLYIIDRMNEAIRKKNAPLDDDERFGILEEIVDELSPHNKLNLLIYDEQILYAHSNYRNSLYMRTDNGGVVFSTRPLGEGSWKLIPFLRLVSFRDGIPENTGSCHHNEYIPDPEEIKNIFMAYSGL